MEEKKYSMTWLSIYTALFVVRTISLTFSVVSILFSVAKYGMSNDSTVVLILIVLLLEWAFEVFALIHFLKKTQLGYTLNMIYIFTGIVFSALNVYFRHLLDGAVDSTQFLGTIIACVVMLAAWSVPNYIYFKHRKFLFKGTLSGKNAVTASSQDPTPVADASAAAAVQESAPANSSAKPLQSGSIPVKELKLLKELHESGVLSDEEFEAKKKTLLGI